MSVYQHFRKEEYSFIDHVIEWREQVKTQYSFKLLDFLDPREQEIVKSIIGTKDEVKCSFWGGYDGAERKRAIFYPEYYEPTNDDFDLVLFSIQYPTKFVSIEHPKVLGSLMGLGLKRSKFGDILMEDDNIQFLVSKQVSDYVKLNLTKVGKTDISLSELGIESIIKSAEDTWQEQTVTVSSLRLDVILAELYHLSRQKVLPYIQSDLVKVNWKTVDNPAYTCHQGDTISMRGFGRSKLISIVGQTKKEKWRIIVGKKK
ncbi:YlmH family RNA-binding protein [Bacillus sp. Marseille-P3661]|uniref:YlmH family RNA-binding protein n=1 Tax=Bacillus sp. Marseille-P3661 TaxID=1936234 RepID=UPI000C8384A7|nr:RNA-binding protein [Bacillus sp. Marseille-P3661]